ncbi:unnamed protein product [Didymodactylos carnosus]|uniref:Cytochrome P450 n=1 Tax=Didymodactylos carnosus TaxID=1234261 RepID=A0A815H5X0_9BILA|nr:unnamed protein product [Didymodactylos carnosus]CAF4214527.1 unnamed protein product [Didymodactylos carnosus]
MISDKHELNGKPKICGLFELSDMFIFVASAKTLYGDIDPILIERDFKLFDSKLHWFFAQSPHLVYSLFLREALHARCKLIETFARFASAKNSSSLTKFRTDTMQSYPEWFTALDIGTNHMVWFRAAIANTIPAAFWSLFNVLHDHQALTTICNEVKQFLPEVILDERNEFDESQWLNDSLASCVNLESAACETLRMVSPPMVLRICLTDIDLELYDGKILKLRKGERLTLFPAVSHYDERLFPDPFQYKFDRFLNSPNLELAEQKVSIAYSPFGGGKSMCPGGYLAKNEVKVFLALVLQHIKCEFIDNDKLSSSQPKVQPERVGSVDVPPPQHDVKIKYQYR